MDLVRLLTDTLKLLALYTVVCGLLLPVGLWIVGLLI